MVDDTRPPQRGAPDDPQHTDPETLRRLQTELTDLRLRLQSEVRTRCLVVTDEAGIGRIRLTAASGGDCEVVLLDEDGFERVTIAARPDMGLIMVGSRTDDDDPTRVDLFALDAEDDADAPYIGLELIGEGDSRSAIAHYGRPRLMP